MRGGNLTNLTKDRVRGTVGKRTKTAVTVELTRTRSIKQEVTNGRDTATKTRAQSK